VLAAIVEDNPKLFAGPPEAQVLFLLNPVEVVVVVVVVAQELVPILTGEPQPVPVAPGLANPENAAAVVFLGDGVAASVVDGVVETSGVVAGCMGVSSLAGVAGEGVEEDGTSFLGELSEGEPG
jgi:hypothetical protein